MMNLISEYNKYKITQWKISVTASLIIHVILALLILFIPANKKEKVSPFTAKLITPDEFNQMLPSAPSLMSRPNAGAIPHKRRSFIKPMPPKIAPPGDQKESQRGPSTPVPSEPGAKEDSQAGSKGITAPPAGRPSSARQNAGKAAPSIPLREKLFDREIVQRFAQREEVKKDRGITFDSDEFRYQTYMVRLKEKIEGVWKYPPDAAMKGIYGDLKIKFTIKKDGMLGAVELERTSGHRNLDEAAIQALKDAEPFWPLPDEWGKEAITITGHFVYSLYGTYIR